MKTLTVTLGALIVWLPAISFGQTSKTFDSAEAAAQALIEAAEKDDVAGLFALFGPAGKAVLTSGDPEQDRRERTEFARLARNKHQLEPDPMNAAVMILSIGSEDWPFPVPIVRSKDKWSFDVSQGVVEMRARRIAKFDADVVAFLNVTGLKAKRTSIRSPWQNGIAERWVGSCRGSGASSS